MKVTVTDSQLRSWRLQGYSLARIASACNLTISQTSRRLQQIWRDDGLPRIDPRPDEIRRRCEEIQAEWSDAERQRRTVGRARQWRPAVVPASVLALAGD
jgi:hypothetical protein